MSVTVGTRKTPQLHNEIYDFVHPALSRQILQGKVTVITGSAGTIGLATAESFAVAGARLVLHYNRSQHPIGFEKRCHDLGATSVNFVQGDISRYEECESMIKDVQEAIGKIDILINNAGTNKPIAFHMQKPELILQDLSTNLLGPSILMRLVLPDMIKTNSGCIINVTSKSAVNAMPFTANYCAAKSALTMQTHCIQKELDMLGATGVHTYSIHPGAVVSNIVEAPLDPYFDDLPQVKQSFLDFVSKFKTAAHLPGMVMVKLSTGIAKEALAGRYFDVEHDLSDILGCTEELKTDPSLYTIGTRYPGGLQESGGTVVQDAEQAVDFDAAVARNGVTK